jgi:cell division septal protein FtsQ
MSLRRSSHSSRAGRERGSASTLEAAARAKRARDHLARKRHQDRLRLERDRARAESMGDRAKALVAIAPILFVLAVVLGVMTALPVAELVLLRGTRLERVSVQGAATLSAAAIAREAGVAAGTSLDAITPSAVREALLAEPWIESVRSLRLPNGTLVVAVVERRAVARWHSDSPEASEGAEASNVVQLVDRSGARFVGDPTVGGPMPLVRGSLGAEEDVPEAVFEILEEIGRTASLSARSDVLTLHLPARATSPTGPVPDQDSGYVLQVGEQGPRALLGDRLLSQRVARLAALFEAEETTFKAAQWIDLRYADRAVLRTKPASG